MQWMDGWTDVSRHRTSLINSPLSPGFFFFLPLHFSLPLIPTTEVEALFKTQVF